MHNRAMHAKADLEHGLGAGHVLLFWREISRVADELDAGVAEHGLGAAGDGQHLLGEPGGVGDVVGVHPGDPRGPGLGDPAVEGVDDALVVQADHPQARVGVAG